LRILTTISVVGASAVVLSPPAAAHGFSKGSQIVARVTAAPVAVEVLGRDDELRLSNPDGRRTIVVLGYAGEPYLRFDRRGVAVNLSSPAVTLNATRFPSQRLWDTLSRKKTGAPRWQQVSDADDYQWVDHRIHLISKTPPAVVRDDPGKPRLLRRWTVPLLVDGRAAAIRGDLRYHPSRFDWVGAIPAFVGLAVVILAIVSVVVSRQSSSRGKPDQRTGDSSSMPS
jgi:hypothetical protein